MKRTALLSVLAVVVGLALATGAVAAVDAEGPIIDEEVTVTNDTQTVWYEVVADDDLDGSTLNASVEWEGLESDEEAGNGTVLDSEDIEITEDGGAETGEYSLTDDDREDFDRVRIYVNGTDAEDNELVNETDYGFTEKVSGVGGGGGFLSGAGGSSGVAALLVVLLGVAYFKRGN